MRLYPEVLLLKNLRGDYEGEPSRVRVYMTKEEALQGLIEMTGQNFGYDWRRWKRHLYRTANEYVREQLDRFQPRWLDWRFPLGRLLMVLVGLAILALLVSMISDTRPRRP